MTDPALSSGPLRHLAASAPGKLILAGEYAVLRGATAIVAAVRRRAHAGVVKRDPARAEHLSPFLAAAAKVLAERADAAEAASLLREAIEVDTGALRGGDGVKLGLGSSAAATVAGVGCALVASGQPLRRDLVHMIARDAHRIAQGGVGSGADVAAATFGGVLWLRDGAHGAIALPEVVWVPVWTGRAADTVTLVAAVDAARAARPADVDAALDAIAAAADALADARDAAQVIAAIDQGGDAIVRLAAAAGVDLETDPVRRARITVRRLGGALKTCGAGGGDVAIAAFPPGFDPAVAGPELRAAGCEPLDLPFDQRGVDIEPPRD